MKALHGSDVLEIKYGDRTIYFDPVGHTYHLDSMPLMSVTAYLKAAGYCHGWHGDGSAALFGRYKHEATAYEDMGDLNFETLNPELMAAVELWRRFKQDEDFVPDLETMERPCFHPIYLYAGTPDVPGTRKGKPCVVEKKFGQKERWHHLQVGGGYTPMLAQHYPKYKNAESLLVYMPKGADKPEVVPVTDKKLPALFLSITAVVNGRSIYGTNGRA